MARKKVNRFSFTHALIVTYVGLTAAWILRDIVLGHPDNYRHDYTPQQHAVYLSKVLSPGDLETPQAPQTVKQTVEQEKPSVFGLMVRTRLDVFRSLVVAQNLQELGTKYKVVFFLLDWEVENVTDTIPVDEFFGDEIQAILGRFNVTGDILPYFVGSPSDKIVFSWGHWSTQTWKFALHRLSLFGMFDKYKKILLTDADVVFTAPVDEVFNAEKTSFVYFPEPGMCVLPDGIPGGFILIAPEKKDWQDMLDFAKSVHNKRDPYWALSEMSFIGEYFKLNLNQSQPKNWHHRLMLSYVYTYPLHDCTCSRLDYKTEYGFQNLLTDQIKIVKVWHFTPGPKPWRYSLTSDGAPDWTNNKDPNCIRRIVEHWAVYRNSILSRLTSDEIDSFEVCKLGELDKCH